MNLMMRREIRGELGAALCGGGGVWSIDEWASDVAAERRTAAHAPLVNWDGKAVPRAAGKARGTPGR